MEAVKLTKKIIAGILALCMTTGAFALPASAVSGVPAENGIGTVEPLGKIKKNSKFVYQVNPDGTVTIHDLTPKAIGANGVVTIPAKIGGKKVTTLSYLTSDFFRKNWKKIKVVDVPKSLDEMSSSGIGFTDDIDMGVRSVNGGYSYKRNQKVTIRCYKGTGAEDYAVNLCVPCKIKNKSGLAPVVLRDSMSLGRSAAKLSWFPVDGASGYQVLAKSWNEGDTDYKVVKTITGKSNTTFKATGIKYDDDIFYVVRAFKKTDSGKKYGRDSAVVEVLTNPSDVRIKKHSVDTEFSLGIETDARSGLSNYNTLVEIFDPESEQWYEACADFETGDKSDIYVITGFYAKSAFSNRTIFEQLKTGVTYKVRMRYCGYMKNKVVYKRYNGSLSNTLSIKVK